MFRDQTPCGSPQHRARPTLGAPQRSPSCRSCDCFYMERDHGFYLTLRKVMSHKRAEEPCPRSFPLWVTKQGRGKPTPEKRPVPLHLPPQHREPCSATEEGSGTSLSSLGQSSTRCPRLTQVTSLCALNHSKDGTSSPFHREEARERPLLLPAARDALYRLPRQVCVS